ncbi:hypothetical protein ACGFZP_13325 [Kitasatospora sp. NPDC048239]|uniref:hypothetical protein n=1 Tax=Kitasatospora sp. NPDC048239 TaxID=3364046 RepID=UPI00372352A7
MSTWLNVVDHEKADGHQPGTFLNRSFYLNDVPRLILLCRLFGHRPVVDGYGSGTDGRQARWVACGRCGVRPKPQGDLDPVQWRVGQRYRGPFIPAPPRTRPQTLTDAVPYVAPKEPGLWPTAPTTTVSGQIVVGRSELHSISAAFKVGNDGSENALGGSITLGRLGALYLSTGDLGRRVQRLLNSLTYESRVIEVSAYEGHLSWKVWAPRNSSTKGTPRWMDGYTTINLLDRWLGPVRFSYEDIGPKRPGRVLMPEGDAHEVTLQLQRQRKGRRRGRPVESWTVDWTCHPGIPVRNHSWKGDEVLGSSVEVTAAAVDGGRWAEEACAQIAADMSRDRAHYRWRGDSAFPKPDPDADFDVEVS